MHSLLSFAGFYYDFKKYNKESIDDCFPSTNSYYAIKFTFNDGKEAHELTTSNWKEDKTIKKRLAPQLITLYKDEKKINTEIIIEIQDA